MAKDKFKNAVRFKLVQKSVRDQTYRDQQDTVGDGSTVGGKVVAGQEARTFAPMNEAARELLSEVLGTPLLAKMSGISPVSTYDQATPPQELSHDDQQAGEAAKYGIFFDDRKYDYGKHLKVIGEAPDAVFIPATPPTRNKEVNLAHMFDDEELAGKGYPDEAEDDPTVKEVLEALEDEAYEDENFEDDFIVKLDRNDDTAVLCPLDSLPARAGQYRNFTKRDYPPQADNSSTDNDEDECWVEDSENDQSIGSSRRGTAYAASMAVTSIDNKFDQVMRLYDGDSDDISDVSLIFSDDDGEDRDSGRGILNEQQVEAALEEFLLTQRDYIRPPVEERKTSAVSLLNELRQELGPLPASVLDRELSDTPDEDALEAALRISSDSESDQFDCQSIITTYTNTENLPGVVRESPRRPFPSFAAAGPTQIRLSRKTGMPIIPEAAAASSSENDDDQATVITRGNKGEARKKEEAAEEKKARKAAVKEERRQNRVMKKELRVRFQLGKETPEAPDLRGKSKKKPLRSSFRV